MESSYLKLTVSELPKEESELVKKSKAYAIKCHEKVNHLYDGKPYSFHLQSAADFGYLFIYLIPKQDRDDVIASIWNHDVLEDTRKTYNDLKKSINEKVANIVYALTNEKGKTRAERANSKYYAGIRNTEYAVFAKLCDRLGNMKYSYEKWLSDKLVANIMFDKYYAENPKFIWNLIKPEWYEFHQHVLHLLIGHKNYLRYRKYHHKYYLVITYLENFVRK